MKKQRIILYSSFLMLVIAGALNLSFLKSTLFEENQKTENQPTLLMGLIIDQNDASIPYFLKKIENLDYDKSRISVQIRLLNESKDVNQAIQNWVEKYRTDYDHIEVLDDYRLLPQNASLSESEMLHAMIKDSILGESAKQKRSYCFITNSGVFLEPQTLALLVQQRKPIIAPLLRPIPQANDAYRNFFCDVSADGYYKDHPDYMPIARFEKRGSFSVPCVHSAYLIDTEFADKLSFSKNPSAWEFITFSNNARNNGIPQYISNEAEMGFMLHFKDGTTKQEESSFVPVKPDSEVTKPLLEELILPYYTQNPYLEKTVRNFPVENYTLFRIQNRDLYWLDDIHDYIKIYILKLNSTWEESIHDQFKRHAIPGTVALDIGGHIGTHALNLSRLVGDQGTVHVFEPQTKIFCELRTNMYLNGCRNIVFHPQALGIEEKEIEIHFPAEGWMASYPKGLVNEGHGTVKNVSEASEGNRTVMVRLDDLNIDHISIIKLDVEGFEMDVIRGGLNTIKRSMPTMIIEIFGNQLKNGKIKEIESLGYVSSHLGGDDYLFVPISKTGSLPKE